MPALKKALHLRHCHYPGRARSLVHIRVLQAHHRELVAGQKVLVLACHDCCQLQQCGQCQAASCHSYQQRALTCLQALNTITILATFQRYKLEAPKHGGARDQSKTDWNVTKKSIGINRTHHTLTNTQAKQNVLTLQTKYQTQASQQEIVPCLTTRAVSNC